MPHLVQENFAARILEVHVQLNYCTVVVINLNMFQCTDMCNKLQ